MYFSAKYTVQIALISQVVPQLGGRQTKQVFVQSRLSRAYLALARLSCYYSPT